MSKVTLPKSLYVPFNGRELTISVHAMPHKCLKNIKMPSKVYEVITV